MKLPLKSLNVYAFITNTVGLIFLQIRRTGESKAQTMFALANSQQQAVRLRMRSFAYVKLLSRSNAI
jgi:hypothetical protein